MNKILIILLLPIFAIGQENDSLRLEKYIQTFSSLNEFMGTILVIQNNKTVIEKSYGFADLEKNNLNSADTKFRLGSCSKQFTAIAILQLQEQGILSVSDKLSKYFPKVAKSDSITIDMLLSHRAGIHNVDADDDHNNPRLTKDKMLETIERYPSDFSPGSKYQYSNGGYYLLAAIVEKVSNKTFDKYLSSNIFKRCGMDSSGVDHNEASMSNKAIGHIYRGGKFRPAPYDNMLRSMGCGNLYSTANDIYKYFRALNDTVLLNKTSMQQFLIPKKENKMHGLTPSTGYYAYGIIADTLGNHPLFTHGGRVYGFTSDITFFLDDNTLIVVLFNIESNVNAWSLSQGLRAVLFNVPVTYPYKYKRGKIKKDALQKYVGQYGPIKMYVKNGHLYLNDTSGPDGEIRLIPETETLFFYENENDRQVEFRLDNDNRVIDSWVIASGLKYKLTQKE